MEKRILLSALPLLCLVSCQSISGDDADSFSDAYKPDPSLPYVLRSGESLVNEEEGYANLREGVDTAKSLSYASSTGETLIFYFYNESCHFCEEVKRGFAGFLEKTNIKVLSYTYASSPNYLYAISVFKSLSKEATEAFFNDWGTPCLFSYKDGEFSKIPLYGNHGSVKVVTNLMESLYSFPYLYEFTTLKGMDSFLEKDYPVYLLNEGEELPSLIKTSIQTSDKKIGYVPKSLLSEEDLKKLEEAHGNASCLLTSAGEMKKEDCSSYLESYFES